VNTLTDEVRSLKATVAAMRSQPPHSSASSSFTVQSRSGVVVSKGKGNGNGRKGKRKGETEGKGNNANTDVPVGPECSGHKGLATDSGKSSTPVSSNKKARIPVNNARKIWGTLRSTACSAVTSAIKRLTSAPLCEKLTVKRKFRSSQEGIIKKWWFMVRGNQPDLRILEEEWHKIEIQTGWKLEPVFQFDNSAVDEAPAKVKPGSPTMTLPQQLPNVSLQVPVESNAERASPLPINDPQSQP